MKLVTFNDSDAMMAGQLILGVLLLTGSPGSSAADPICQNVRDCSQRAEQHRQRAQNLRRQRLALTKELERKNKEWKGKPPPKPECRQTPQGIVCSTSGPLSVDDRPALEDTIERLAAEERQHESLAQQSENQARALGSRDSQYAGAAGATSGPPSASCFIATAAYGSPMAEDVVVLQRFRDAHLLDNQAGRLIVRVYNAYSPSIAAHIAKSELARILTRAALKPAIHAVKHPLQVALAFFVLATLLSAVAFRQPIDKQA